jgi:hypothetical protein
MQTEIREVPKSFTGKGEVRGVEFTQIAKTEKGYIYHRSDGYFEVFRRKINQRFNIVSYPGSKSFGDWAWCCRTEEKAHEYLARF